MRLLRARGLFKGLFFRFKFHIVLSSLSYFFIVLGNMIRLSAWISKQKNLGLNDFYTFKFDYNKRFKLYEFVSKSEKLDDVIYLEFGVAGGSSFRWWVKEITNPNSVFHGFDTFTGLPEDWGPYKKGDMSTKNSIPDIADSRVIFHQGLFQNTFPLVLPTLDFNRRLVLHLDADLYSSTLFVLTTIAPKLKKGDIVIFDEFNVPAHEFQALNDFQRSYYINFVPIASVNNFYQTAFIVE